MNQVLGVFGVLDFTMLWPVLAWRAFCNLRTIYVFNFPTFWGRRCEPQITETMDAESADTGATPVPHKGSVHLPCMTYQMLSQ
jgi:hypothetical protein